MLNWIFENKQLLNHLHHNLYSFINNQPDLELNSEDLYHNFIKMLYDCYLNKQIYETEECEKKELIELKYTNQISELFSNFRTIAYHYQSNLFNFPLCNAENLIQFIIDNCDIVAEINESESESESDIHD